MNLPSFIPIFPLFVSPIAHNYTIAYLCPLLRSALHYIALHYITTHTHTHAQNKVHARSWGLIRTLLVLDLATLGK